MTQLVLYGFVLMFSLMTILWILHLIIENAGIVDVGWAAGLALLSVFYAAMGNGFLPRRILIGAIVFFWGMRLAVYLLFNRVVGHPEDGRYTQLRREWKTNLSTKFFFFFQFQAVLNVVLALPFLLICLNPEPAISAIEWLGVGLWIIAVAGESVADAQLSRFRADLSNRGKVCESGLWNYSRHPNYFFEWLIWISYFLIALASPYGWISVLSPLIILYFLLRVTGIPATEAQAVRSKGDAYIHYQKTTSVFVPWFKREAY
jgi:steroid 5-alpha reductase family enzyme